MKSKVFVCGCPRSGTTAMWRIFKSIKNIAIGVERYNNLAINDFTLSEAHFQKERYFKYKKEDSHWGNLTTGVQEIYYRNLRGRYHACKYVGDKIPKLYKNFDPLFKTFDSIHVFAIVRNILDVSHSYKVRKENPDDAWRATFQDAIYDWNESLVQILKFKELYPKNMHILDYEKIFYMDFELKNIFRPLDIDVPEELKENFKKEKARAAELDHKKVLSHTTIEKRYLMETANFENYKKAINLAL